MRPAAGSGPAAARATYTAFGGSGFAFAGWASRIPQLKARLELSPASLGLVLLAIAAGSLVALPLSGQLVRRAGSRRTVAVTSVLLAVALATVAAGFAGASIPVVVGGLLLLGFANGAWDVAMNIQGAAVERQLQRSVMSRFHAGYSLGTVAGALLGAAAVAAGLPVPVHLLLIAAAVVLVVPAASAGFLRDRPAGPAPRVGHRSPWREPRTLAVGLCVLAFAFTEGTGNDWASLAAIEGHGVTPAAGTVAFALFLAAMTAVRYCGPGLLDRYGRVPLVRALLVVALAGLLVFVLSPSVPLAYAGVLLWGAGASLGFPVGMSAASDDPSRAPARVSVVASVGYCAFLAGPPLVGLLGDRIGVLRALLAVAGALALGGLTSSALAGAAPADPT